MGDLHSAVRNFNRQRQGSSSSHHRGETSFSGSEGENGGDSILSARIDIGHGFQNQPQTPNVTPPARSQPTTSVELSVHNLLYRAALTGDWRKAESLIDVHPWAIRVQLTFRKETALQIAVTARQTTFVEKLVKRMVPADLALQNIIGYRALCFAAISGIVRIAEVLVEKNPNLPLLSGFNASVPLYLAVVYKRKDIAYYLLSVTDIARLKTTERLDILHASITSDYYDIGWEILRGNPNLALGMSRFDRRTALHLLAQKPHAIGSRSQLGIWEKCIKFCFKGIYSKALMKTLAHQMVESLWKTVLERFPEEERLSNFIKTPSKFLHDAAKVGNVEFLIVLIRLCPDLIWHFHGLKTIFHVAVENRQENVFKLIYEIGGVKDVIANLIDKNDYINMLYLAANMAAPNHLNRVSGPALQMQRELQWFKEVEKIVAPPFSAMTYAPSDLREQRDSPQSVGTPDGLTLREIFTEKHKQLRKDGEEWMKSTSNSCMLVATLIATVVFAAAFTVPGGNNDNTGAPIFRNRDWFSVFVISDATALISSSISIMMFLSILTSRFAEEDFLDSLPWRLLIGLAALFISIVCMVVAFSATFFMLYDRVNAWVPWAVAAMAIAPITCFGFLQYKLWADTFRATFWSKYLFKPRRRMLFV